MATVLTLRRKSLAIKAVRQNTKTRRISDLLTVAEHYRDLWGRTQNEPEMQRIGRKDPDLIRTPVTSEEEKFLNRVIIHFNTSWLMAREGALLSLEALTRDVQAFFTLPIPSSVWLDTRQNRDPAFARFLDRCLEDGEKNSTINSKSLSENSR